jgi:hypothetical protein
MSWKEETTTGQGGQKTGTGIYEGKFEKNGKQFVAKTNVETGAVDIYETNQGLFGLGGDKLVSQFSPTNNKWTITEDGKKLRDGDFGAGNFVKLQDETRISAYDNVLKDNASQEVKDKNGFKSRSGLSNVPPEEGTGRGGPSDIEKKPPQNQNKKVEKSKSPVGTEGARYPLDIENTNQDRIMFQAVELSGRKSVTGSTTQVGKGFGAPSSYSPVSGAGPVYITIQGPIQDQSSVEWGDSRANPLELAGANTAAAAIDKNQSGTETGVAEIKRLAEAAGENVVPGAAALAVGKADLFTRATQQVLNPNLELLFKGPQNRPFNFSFKMSAREGKEAEEIQKIIKYFKYHMAVKGEGGDIFLKAPDVFWIEYRKGNNDLHQSLNLIAPGEVKRKACALRTFNVDYTPLGTYMTFNDERATMVQYNISLSFQEITPVYQSDFDEEPGKNHPIGY